EVDALEDLVVAEGLHQAAHLDGRRVDVDQVSAHLSLAIRRSSQADSRVIGIVTTRYSSAAITRGVPLAFWLARSRANVVSSRVIRVVPAMNTSEVSFSSSTNSFVSGGMMMRKPCGRITQNIVFVGDM